MPTDRVFYDGSCGFCHWSIQMLLAEDRKGNLFRYAPLGGPTFRALVPDAERTRLPDSLVVFTADGRLLLRSAAVLHLLRRLGGWWRILGFVLVLLPSVVRDLLYDGFAAIRQRLFRRPKESCPLLSPSLRSRFDP